MGTGVRRVEAEAGAEAKRVRRSVAEKRRIVEATLVRGVSVARVAREHGVNANQVFYWRHQYRQGRLGAAPEAGALIAVREPREPRESERRQAAPHSGIQLELRRGRVESGADAGLLRIVLEHLVG
ncbi:MAG: IS66-like element accessory protein TnpA [Terriglobales bacterium]